MSKAKTGTWLKNFAKRKKARYFYDDESEVYLKLEPGTGPMAKVAGGEEYSIKAGNDIVTRALHARAEITREEYEKA